MRPLSLRVRLGIWSALMLALPLVVFSCVVAVDLYSEEVDALDRELRVESVSVLARMLDAEKTGRDPVELRALIEPFHPFLEVIRTADRSPVYRSAMLAGRPCVTDPTATGTVRTLEIAETAVRQATAASDGLAVSLGASLARPRLKLRQLLRSYAIAAPFLLVAFALGAVWVARRALHPIEEIAARAEGISAASLDARLPVPAAKDELRRLTEVLNGMMGRLEGSFSQIARFTSDASHELRTPLAVLRAELETALQPGTTDEARVARIHTILDEVRRLSSLVDGLLFLSRSDAGKLELDLHDRGTARVRWTHSVGPTSSEVAAECAYDDIPADSGIHRWRNEHSIIPRRATAKICGILNLRESPALQNGISSATRCVLGAILGQKLCGLRDVADVIDHDCDPYTQRAMLDLFGQFTASSHH